MIEKWSYIPTNKEKLESLEVLVNENDMNGLFVQYNGIHVDRLHEFFGLNESAKYFTTKIFHNSSDSRETFTDSHGRRVDLTNPDAVFFSFESDDQNEVKKIIKYLAESCINQDLNINMTAHLNSDKFAIVADKDELEYSNIGEGTKGISYDQLDSLIEAMRLAKTSSIRR